MIVEYDGSNLDSFSEPELLFTGPYANIGGMEYRMMPGGSAILQRPINTDQTIAQLELITGFNAYLEDVLK